MFKLQTMYNGLVLSNHGGQYSLIGWGVYLVCILSLYRFHHGFTGENLMHTPCFAEHSSKGHGEPNAHTPRICLHKRKWKKRSITLRVQSCLSDEHLFTRATEICITKETFNAKCADWSAGLGSYFGTVLFTRVCGTDGFSMDSY